MKQSTEDDDDEGLKQLALGVSLESEPEVSPAR